MTARDEQIDLALDAAATAIDVVHNLLNAIRALREDDAPEDAVLPPAVVEAGVVLGGPIQTALTGNRRTVGAGIADWPPVAHIPDGEVVEADVVSEESEVPGPAIEGAMPPNHCRNHREPSDHCRNCMTAQEAQDAWRLEFDAKTRAAKEQVEAELAADDVHLPPGRTAFRVAKAQLDARATAKPAAPSVPMATPEQLTAIATVLGDAGVTTRDVRLDLLSQTVGRALSTSRDLTRAEASYVIDRLVGPPLPVDPPGDDPSTGGPEGGGGGTLDPAATQAEDDPGVLDMAAGGVSAAEAAESTDLNVNANAWADDGTEPEPEGDPDVEREYLRDRDTWGVDELQLTITRSTDDPPF